MKNKGLFANKNVIENIKLLLDSTLSGKGKGFE